MNPLDKAIYEATTPSATKKLIESQVNKQTTTTKKKSSSTSSKPKTIEQIVYETTTPSATKTLIESQQQTQETSIKEPVAQPTVIEPALPTPIEIGLSKTTPDLARVIYERRTGQTISPINNILSKKTVFGSSVSQLKPYSQDFFTTSELQQSLQQQEKQQLSSSMRGIDPFGTYEYKGKTYPGAVLLSSLQREYRDIGKKTYDLDKYPTGTTFKKSKDDTYDVIIPETAKHLRTEKELKEINELPIGLREISRTGYFALQSMYSMTKPISNIFGLGEQHDVFSNIAISFSTHPFQFKKSIKSTIKGYEAGRYGVHHVSLFDYAFEPIGWSPKGSTAILTKYPVTSTVGGGLGEIAQGVAVSGLISGIGKTIIKPGIKAGVRSGEKVLTKFINVFPDEKIISSGIKKIGETSFGKNIYRWGLKGYEPALRLTSQGAVKSSETLIKGTQAETRVISRKLIEGGGKRIERVFLSPKQASWASKQISKKLGTRMDIVFPKASDIATSYYKTTRLKGLFTKRLVTSEKAFYTTWKKTISGQMDDVFSRSFVLAGKKQGTGFVREKIGSQLYKQSDEAIQSSYITPLKPYKARFKIGDIVDIEKTSKAGIEDIYDIGTGGFQYKKIYSLGDIYEEKLVQPRIVTPGSRFTKFDFFTGPSKDTPMTAWAKQMTKAEEKWISTYRWKHPLKTLMKDITATQKIIPKLETGFLKKTTNIGYGRTGLIQRMNAVSIPLSLSSKAVSFPLFLGLKTYPVFTEKTYEQITIQPSKSTQQNYTVVLPKTILDINEKKSIKKIVLPQTTSEQKYSVKIINLELQSEEQQQKQVQKTIQLILPRKKTVKASISTFPQFLIQTKKPEERTFVPTVPITPKYFPYQQGLYGGGRRGYGLSIFGSRKAIRSVKIKSPFSGIAI